MLKALCATDRPLRTCAYLLEASHKVALDFVVHGSRGRAMGDSVGIDNGT